MSIIQAAGVSRSIFYGICVVFAVCIVAAGGAASAADDVVVAKVNGRTITEADVRLAEAEILHDLTKYPPATRRRVVIEFLIQNELFAEAAASKNVAASKVFKERKHYWDRRSLRETYFETEIRSQVTDAEAMAFYNKAVQNQPRGQQVRASHILVATEDEAKVIFELIAHDGDFAELARKHSRDAKSKDLGGDLGFFGRGKMAAKIEETAFSLPVGETSVPVQSGFGWHIIKVLDKRDGKPPAFEAVKEQIVTQLMHDKARALAESLRGTAKIEYLDPAAKQQ